MSLEDFGSFTIGPGNVTLGRAGFKSAALVSYTGWSTAERIRKYKRVDQVAADFASLTSLEQRTAFAYFRESPKPDDFYIIKGTRKPTKVLQLSAVNPAGKASYTYRVRVGGEGFDEQTVSWTSDASPSDAEYAAAAVTALNSVSGKNYTATGATLPVSMTGTTPGAWFYAVVEDRTTQSMVETTANPGIELDLAEVSKSGWHVLLTGFDSTTYATPASVWAETNEKLYLPDTADTHIWTDASNGTADPADIAKTTGKYRNTAWYCHPDASQRTSASAAGKCVTFTPGQETWAMKPLSIAGYDMTPTEFNNVMAKNANTIRQVDGDIYATKDGKTASGEYIDVTRVAHWQVDDLRKSVVGLLISVPKVAMTDAGLQKLGTAARASLEKGVNNEAYDSYTLNIPERKNLTDDDVANRIASEFTFEAVLTGAVHYPIMRGRLVTTATT